MNLAFSLLIIFALFCLMMAGVLACCLRERARKETIDHSIAPQAAMLAATPSSRASLPLLPACPAPPTGYGAASNAVDEEADLRVATIIFGSIILGLLFAVVTGYLVFFRDWNS